MADVIRIADPDNACSLAADQVRMYLESARARNTIRGYRASFHQFQRWCEAAHLSYLPATGETIALYLSSQAGRLRPSTLEHHLAAIGKAHKAAGYESPIGPSMLVAETLKGIKRTHGTAAKQKAPIRRSELVGLDVSDLAFQQEGLLVTLRRSKTDQEGQGRAVAIPFGSSIRTCPVRAIASWLELAKLDCGPVFRPIRKGGSMSTRPLTGHAVASLVKRYAKAAGLKPEVFSGHSLRAGFVTSAARAGEPERRIMRQTGHKSIEMVLRYVRQANAFQDNAANSLGL